MLLLLLVLVLVYLIWRCTGCRKTIVRYYSPSCGYCVSSQEEWDKFKMRSVGANYEVVCVNTQEDTPHTRKWLAKHKPDGVPTVVKFDGHSTTVHSGERTCESYLAFALE